MANLFPTKDSPSMGPKTAIHGVIVALAVLNAVGLFVIYFKLDMIAAKQTTVEQQTYLDMEELGNDMQMMGQKVDEMKPNMASTTTKITAEQPMVIEKNYRDFMTVTLNKGQTLRLTAPEDELGNHFFLTVADISRGGAGGIDAYVTALDNGVGKGAVLQLGKNWEASVRFTATVKQLDETSITFQIGRNDNSPFTP